MSQRDIVALAFLTVFFLIAALAIVSIRRRVMKQSDIGALSAPDSLSGAQLAAVDAKYVSTVFADRPLERVVSNGLMHRGLARLVLLQDGIQVIRVGERSFAIRADAIRDVSRASATIDRGVENSGLVALTWMLGSTEVTTNFRLSAADDTSEFFKLLTQFKTKVKNHD
jgi:hypothetical protein